MKKYLLTAIAFGLFLQWGIGSLDLTARTKAYADSRDAQLNSVMDMSSDMVTEVAKQALVVQLESEFTPGCDTAATSLREHGRLTEADFYRWLAKAKTTCPFLRNYTLTE